jgi:U3 small nucleolar RNA-associated protein 25
VDRKAPGRLSGKKRTTLDEEPTANGPDDDVHDDDLELRDRGFAKTRLLLVLPMRNLALRYLRMIKEVLGVRDSVGQAKFDMFERDFTEIVEAIDPRFGKRPLEYQRQFDGNINDTFCVGASMRATGVSVYSHVLNSDILVCSPLGLRRRVAKDADVLVSLSSVEVAVVDQADVLWMQNWEHFTELMKLVNRTPSDTTEGLMDLRRVYPWALKGHAAAHRQTLLLSSIANAGFSSFMRGHCTLGHRSLAQLTLAASTGVIPTIKHGVRQFFVRFPTPSLADLDAARFEFFKTQVFPSKVKPLIDHNVHTILYVPSTFDFLQLRVFLDEQVRGSFAELTEHTSEKAPRKALGQFSALERPLLVMTERFFYFKRYLVKHAEALVCYSPPLYPEFYATLVNRLSSDSPNATVLCPFTRYDLLELQRILGTQRAQQVLTRPTDSFIFVSTTAAGNRAL